MIGHQIQQRGEVVIDEEQAIVYRDAAANGGQPPDPAPPALAPSDSPPSDSAQPGPPIGPADGEWPVEVTPTLLFRFSALTYNAHRIHYDRDYARQVEGYPGLLTHGPLQALAMAEAARAARDLSGQEGVSFDYRLTAPLFDHQGMIVSATPAPGALVTAVRDAHGRQTATGILRASH